MIKILFYIDELVAGGAEKVLCNLVNNMDQNKFDITVHTAYKSDAASLLKQGITYRYIYEKKTSCNRMLYRLEGKLGLFYSLHLKGNYDIEVAYLECGPTKMIASSTNQKALKLAWIHCDLEKKIEDMDAFVRKTTKYYKKYDRVICVSEDCKESYEKYFMDCPKALVQHNTIDDKEVLEKARLTAQQEIKKDTFTIVVVGRMTEQKNFKRLLNIHKELLKKEEHDLWILGDGEQRAELEEYIKTNHLEQHTKLWGFQNNPYPIMKEADLFVCSSLYEGYSTALIEAMILGLPVVTTDCTGMREILGDSEYGLITANSDEGLLSGVEYMISHKKVLQEYQKKAVTRSRELCGHRVADQTGDFFKELLYRKAKR